MEHENVKRRRHVNGPVPELLRIRITHMSFTNFVTTNGTRIEQFWTQFMIRVYRYFVQLSVSMCSPFGILNRRVLLLLLFFGFRVLNKFRSSASTPARRRNKVIFFCVAHWKCVFHERITCSKNVSVQHLFKVGVVPLNRYSKN